jgi:hypothetical protein
MQLSSKFYRLANPTPFGSLPGSLDSNPINPKLRRKGKQPPEQSPQPLMQEWFTNLKVEERVLVTTTIDPVICSQIKIMV